MAKKPAKAVRFGLIREHGVEWLFVTLLTGVVGLGIWLALITIGHANALKNLQDKQEDLEKSVTAIKKAIISLSLAKDPKNAEVVGALVVDRQTAKGIEQYRQGDLQLAIGTWEQAKAMGSDDARIALQAAGVEGPDRIEVTGSRIRTVPWWERLMFWKNDEKDRADEKK